VIKQLRKVTAVMNAEEFDSVVSREILPHLLACFAGERLGRCEDNGAPLASRLDVALDALT